MRLPFFCSNPIPCIRSPHSVGALGRPQPSATCFESTGRLQCRSRCYGCNAGTPYAQRTAACRERGQYAAYSAWQYGGRGE